LRTVDDVVIALAAQQAELSGLLGGLATAQWRSPTRCEGWDVSDVVLHLAQSDEVAIGSVTGRFAAVVADLTEGVGPSDSVDDGASLMVERERGLAPAELLARWTAGADRLLEELGAIDLSTRVPWVAGELSARTLATTRMTETWIHAGDVAGAVGITLPVTDRLWLISRLAWRTLPYAFSSAGRVLAGPVAFRLTSPGGAPWDFVPDQPAVTTVKGPAAELCAVAARRIDPTATSLQGEGPDYDSVVALVRTYA
jgi:uncharacterized protein (TIGR03084 family)